MTTPCHWYVTCTFGEGPLGFSVVRHRSQDYALGNTVVQDLQNPNGNPSQAARGGVRVGDVITAVNQLYIAFLPHADALAIIKAAARPLVLEFARPMPAAWKRIRSSETAPIKTGNLQKKSGWLNSWRSRTFWLTRESLSYYSEGTFKRTVKLVDIVSVDSTAPQLEENECAFFIRLREKPMTLLASTQQEKVHWIHAIETAMHRAFDREPPPEHPDANIADEGSRRSSSQHQSPQTPPTTSTPPSSSSSSSFASGAGAASASMNGGPPLPPPPMSPRPDLRGTGFHNLVNSSGSARQLMAQKQSGPYWMLRHSRVEIKAQARDAEGEQLSTPPPGIDEALVQVTSPAIAYDFKLERSLVNEQDQDKGRD